MSEESTIPPKKRFIAGAVCPSCGEMDRLVMYTLEQSTYRECVNCGFKEAQRFAFEQAELSTRVNHEDDKRKQETQVLTFEAPKKRH